MFFYVYIQMYVYFLFEISGGVERFSSCKSDFYQVYIIFCHNESIVRKS